MARITIAFDLEAAESGGGKGAGALVAGAGKFGKAGAAGAAAKGAGLAGFGAKGFAGKGMIFDVFLGIKYFISINQQEELLVVQLVLLDSKKVG